MEIALVSPTSIRIKGKQSALLVDPVASKAKLMADAVLMTSNNPTTPEVEGCRLVMAGPGEYEVGGVKITGIRTGEKTAYYLTLEGVSILVAAASELKGKDGMKDAALTLLCADSVVDQSALAGATNSIAIFYGPQAEENVKALGKETQAVSKYVTTKDKLPQEMEVVLLQ